jgi:hypothetical protein
MTRLQVAVVADFLIGMARPFQFRGKARLLNGLVAQTGTRSATVYGYLYGLISPSTSSG